MNYIIVSEAAKLSGVEATYLHKLIQKGELEANSVQQGMRKRWFVNTDCPRFQKLLNRNTPKEAATTTGVVEGDSGSHPIDWTLWEDMLRRGEEIVKRPCAVSTITSYKFYLKRFFKTYPTLNRDSLRSALHTWFESKEEPGRDYYSSKIWLFRSVLSVAKYYRFKGYEPEEFVKELSFLKPRQKHVVVSRPCHSQPTVMNALEVLKVAVNKRGVKAYSHYDEILNRTFVTIANGIAARNGEICRIRVEDINWQERSIRLYGKGGKERTVGMPQSVYEAMKEYRAVRPDGGDRKEFLLYKEGSRIGPMNPKLFARRLKRLNKGYLNNVSNFTPHSLRRAGITRMLTKDKLDLFTVKNAVGHSDIQTTNLYTQPTTEDIVAAMRGLK